MLRQNPVIGLAGEALRFYETEHRGKSWIIHAEVIGYFSTNVITR